MAIQTFYPALKLATPHVAFYSSTSATNDATNENVCVVGYLELAAGSGTKTLSQAGGGSITIRTGTVTFATASTEYRVGLEDVGAAGAPDGTQDVYGAKIAGTHTINANAYNTFAMTSGTKTVSHGDFLAVTCRMPVRAGADSLVIGTFINNLTNPTFASSLPYGVLNSNRGDEMLWAMITFDDGTKGWIKGTQLIFYGTATGVTQSTATTPDEHCATFTVPVPCQVSGIIQNVDDFTAAGDDFAIVLYSDPYGSPSVIQSVAVDSSEISFVSSASQSIEVPITPVTLVPETTYGIALRSTSGTVTVYYGDLGSGFDGLKAMIAFFGDVKVAGRVDNTGAFTEIQTYYVPFMGMSISGFDDGESVGGGGGSVFGSVVR